MEQILCFTDYMKKAFKTKGWWYVCPFALVGIVIAGVFYIYSPIFMLIDYIRYEMRRMLYKDLEGVSGAAQFIILFFVYTTYMTFFVTTVILLLPMAVFYFLTYCFFFVSSLGEVQGNPFAFHLLH